jgi:hypothetical protein
MTKRLTIAVLIATVASMLLLPLVALCDESFKNVFAEQSTPRGSDSFPADPPGVPASLPRGLSLEIDESKAVAAADQVYDITFWSGSFCPPCRTMKPLLLACPRLRVTVEVDKPLPAGVPAPNDPTPPTYPCITFKTSSGRLYYDFKSRTAEQVINAIERAESKENNSDKSSPAESTVTASEAQGSVGSAGVIRGGRLIAVALDWWAAHIGEGVKVSGSWSRNGGQTLPLRRLGKWESTEIYGTHGEFEIFANGSRLPVQSAVLGYKLANGRLKLNAETELDASILNIGNTPQSVVSAQPVGVSPMLILSVLSTVWQLLHPQADLSLPGRVTCDAVMSDGGLLVTFNERPSIRLVMLFTFNLGVESVRVSRESVVIKFAGSRWIKERTFEVRE